MTITDNPLAALRDIDESTLQRLRGALAEKAAEAQLLDLAYTTVDTPLGGAAAGRDRTRPGPGRLRRRGPRRRAAGPGGHGSARGSCGPRAAWSRPPASSTSTSPATAAASTCRWTDPVQGVPARRAGAPAPRSATATRSPTRRSRALAGNPKAVRAVGTACATNPLPVVVPCHRVLRSGRSLGGYLGGMEAKTTLLDAGGRGVNELFGDDLLARPRREVAPGGGARARLADAGAAARMVDRSASGRPGRCPPGGRGPAGTRCRCGRSAWAGTGSPTLHAEADDVNGARVLPLPDWLVRLGRRAWRRRTAAPAAAGYEPDTALVNYYDAEARRWACTRTRTRSRREPVVSLSIGDACLFRFGNTETRTRPYTDVELRSGRPVRLRRPVAARLPRRPKVIPGTAPARTAGWTDGPDQHHPARHRAERLSGKDTGDRGSRAPNERQRRRLVLGEDGLARPAWASERTRCCASTTTPSGACRSATSGACTSASASRRSRPGCPG